MLEPLTLKTLALLIGLLGLIALPGLIWPAYLDSPLGLLVTIPYLSIYLFHGIGVPGLLQNHGACGWGWCAPTVFGWVFLGVFWLLVLWWAAYGIARLRSGRNKRITANDRE